MHGLLRIAMFAILLCEQLLFAQTEVTDHTALFSGDYWSGFDTGPTALPMGRPVFVTYSFATVAPISHAAIVGSAFSTFVALDAAQQQQVRDALSLWGAACGITFLEAAPSQGQMNFATYDFTGSIYDGAGGIAFYPFGDWNNATAPYYHDQAPFDASGDVFLNSDLFSGGLPAFETLLHEIGHALGLKHPWEVVWGHDEVLRPDLDTASNTIMSVNGTSATLGPLDIAAMQAIHGTNAQDGTQVASWSWNSATSTLTQNGFSTADVIIGVGSNDVANGKNGNDRIFGLNGNDQLRGDAGNDILWGGAGNDTLRGGAGADELHGGTGSDTADYYAAVAVVTVALDGSLTATGEAIGDTFDSIEHLRGSNTAADRLRGNGVSNTITGGGGSDTLEGGGGSDRLNGGLGTDTLTGGAGADYFQFYAPGEGIDTITDFASNDFLQFKGSAFGGIAIGTLGTDRFVLGLAADQAFAQFLYDKPTGTLRIDADGTGGGVAVVIAFLGAGKVLVAGDMLIF